MEKKYSAERNVQIIIGLLKANGIKRVVASPGSTNIPFVLSLQNDGDFIIYSCVDERSAAYMAVGIAAELGEPVVLTCTGATASRNYFSALTEAFYRHLPIIAVTSTRPLSRIGHLSAQVIDRTVLPKDIANLSVFAPLVRCADDEWDCQIKVNQAIDATKRNGGGPVHINLETESCFDFSVQEIKNIHPVHRYTINDSLPDIPGEKIAVYVGAHRVFTSSETTAIEKFCEEYNAIVLCDHSSNYHGKYKILGAVQGVQQQYQSPVCFVDIIIYIGEITGSYEMANIIPKARQVWRVAEDGMMRDLAKTLTCVFHMTDFEFFEAYAIKREGNSNLSFYNECNLDYESLLKSVPSNLPFSNIWVASQMAPYMPSNSVVHFAILNSLRSWNFFKMPESVNGFCNTGGFGIDGCISTMIGASLCNKNKVYYCVTGDLAFFYDMNSLGNRHIGNNVRVLIINNGKGMEFRNCTHPIHNYDNAMVDEYVAAGGHYGQQSRTLVKNYVESLGYEYLTASTKEEVMANKDKFLSPKIGDNPIVFEIFTEQENENAALYAMVNLKKSVDKLAINAARKVITSVAGEEGFNKLKNVIRKR